MIRAKLPLIVIASLFTGCDTWRPPAATPEALNRGLVIMYPGAFNTTSEMAGVYAGLRDAGVDQAIEVVPWGLPMANFFMPTEFLGTQLPWAQSEASRIAQYSDEHSDSPVTLLGFSGGAMMCILVAETMPENTSVDWVILMGAGVSPDYDLNPMLERSVRGAVAYWSPLDTISSQITGKRPVKHVFISAIEFGTMLP
jgi:pimeloyl-ACP methyl ester carboxylesterase